MKELWVEKHRPKSVSGYVWRDEAQRKTVEGWIKDKSIPHLLLSGSPGIGKTTMAKMLCEELEVNHYDVLELNASRTNSVDDVRDTITNFVQTIPFGDFKIVLLDEADYLSPNAQGALRGVMEEYHEFARFILTCNFPHKIIPPLHSRCQNFHMEKIDSTEFTARVASILLEEEVKFDIDTLDNYVKVTYPDLRKCINIVQQNVQDRSLIAPNESDAGESDWMYEMVELFKQGKIGEARKVVCKSIRQDEIDGMYKWLYDNIELFGEEQKQEDAILIIKQGMVDHTLVVDPEINLAATMIRLARL